MFDELFNMSNGNIGALEFLATLVKEKSSDSTRYLLSIKLLGLQGSRLYKLWNDCCQRDYEKTYKVLDKFLRDELKPHYILNCVDQPRGEIIEIGED